MKMESLIAVLLVAYTCLLSLAVAIKGIRLRLGLHRLRNALLLFEGVAVLAAIGIVLRSRCGLTSVLLPVVLGSLIAALDFSYSFKGDLQNNAYIRWTGGLSKIWRQHRLKKIIGMGVVCSILFAVVYKMFFAEKYAPEEVQSFMGLFLVILAVASITVYSLLMGLAEVKQGPILVDMWLYSTHTVDKGRSSTTEGE